MKKKKIDFKREINEEGNLSDESLKKLISTVKRADNFLAYVQSGMKGKFNPKKKYKK